MLVFLFIVLISIIIYILYNCYNEFQYNDDIEILQTGNFYKFYELTKKKYPTIMTNISNDIKNISINKLIKNNNDVIIKNNRNHFMKVDSINTAINQKYLIKDDEIYKLFDKHFFQDIYKLSNLSKFNSDIIFNIGQKGPSDNLHYDLNHNMFLIQLSGKKKIILFNTKYKKYLYPIKNSNENNCVYSLIDYWKEETYKDLNLYNNAKYIEIILHEHQILYIPRLWWFVTENLDDDNLTLTFKTNTIFSNILNSFYHT